MIFPNRHSALGAALIGVAVLVSAGCAPTATSRATGEVVDDATLTTKVKTALIGEPTVKAREIEVETYRGVVQLSGFVDSAQMAEKATGIARGVAGVRSVRNDMRVKPGQ